MITNEPHGLNSIDFSDSKLSVWEEPMTFVVSQHTNPDAASRAIIMLCQYVQQIPPFDFNSDEGMKTQVLIRSMKTHQKPDKLMEAALYIKQSGIKIHPTISKEIGEYLKAHDHPLVLARAIVTLFNYDLLHGDHPQTHANFKNLLTVVLLWFGETPVATQLKTFPPAFFTQDIFKRLIHISITGTNIRSILEANINLLHKYDPTILIMPPELNKLTRLGIDDGIYGKNYKEKKQISRSLQADNNEAKKIRSKTEEGQTLLASSARRMSL